MKPFAVPAPVSEILTAYWKADRTLLVLIAGTVLPVSYTHLTLPTIYSV